MRNMSDEIKPRAERITFYIEMIDRVSIGFVFLIFL